MRNKKENELLAEAYGSIYEEGLFGKVKGLFGRGNKNAADAVAPSGTDLKKTLKVQDPKTGAVSTDFNVRAKLEELAGKNPSVKIFKSKPHTVSTEVTQVRYKDLPLECIFYTRDAQDKQGNPLEANIKAGQVKGNLFKLDYGEGVELDDETGKGSADNEAKIREFAKLIGRPDALSEDTMNI